MQNDTVSLAAPAAIEVHMVHGTMRGDKLIGSEGDDQLYAGKGDDFADGRGGIDTAVFHGQYANYTVAQDAATGHWTVQNGRDHATLVNVEFMQFADVRVPVGVASVAKPLPPPVASAAPLKVNETLVGNELGTRLNGHDGDNILIGNGGDDTLYGGKGSDTAVYRGNRSDYIVEFDTASWNYRIVDRVAGRDGSDIVNSIEKLQFADTTLNFADLVRTVPMPAQVIHEGTLVTGFVTGGADSVQTASLVLAEMLVATQVTAEGDVSLIGMIEVDFGSHFGLEYCSML